jgi:hypothetical protein
MTRRCVPFTTADGVVGVGSLFESRLHPHRPMVTINVHPAHQRQGIGSALYDALKAIGDDRPWLVKLTDADIAGMAFFRQRGYKIVVRTLTGVLENADWPRTLPEAGPDYRVLSRDDAGITLEAFAQAQAAIYRQAHRWNPPIIETDAQAIAHYCPPERTLAMVCALRGEALAGACSLIHNPFVEDAPAYLVFFGVLEDAVPAADRYGLTADLIRAALATGRTIAFEVDSVATPNYDLLRDAPAIDRDEGFVIMTSG